MADQPEINCKFLDTENGKACILTTKYCILLFEDNCPRQERRER